MYRFKYLLLKYANQRIVTIIQHNLISSSKLTETIALCKCNSISPTLTNNIIGDFSFHKRYYGVNPKNAERLDNLTEAEYLVKLKHDPDVFGNPEPSTPLDEGDIKDEKLHQEKPMSFQKLSTKQYADIIKSLLKKRKLKEAIDFVEIEMIQHHCVKPENYIYNLLIGACGRVGYTKKAFSLYNDMKRRALQITPGTYTALFNACANSPWPTTDGLTRATHLRSIMIEKMFEPNVTNYNSMIKAFGRCGDLKTAFSLVDEMTAKNYVIKSDTLNFLLQACISDKEVGFRHALLVWRIFVKNAVRPDVYSYNLMLRCIRDCGLGDIETATDVIQNLLPSREKVPMLQDLKTLERLASGEKAIDDISLVVNTPNLMAKVPHLGNILALSEVTTAEHRLLLVGGCKHFLQNMADNNCKPDIKTFTQLLDNIPGTLAAEKELLQDIKKNNVTVDIDFYNMLIKKRSMRFDYASAKEVLGLIESAYFRPNLITYGVLALGCASKQEAESLLEEMSKFNYRLNIEILGAMLKQACHHMNFPYVMYIMELCRTQNIQPSPKFMDILNGFKMRCRNIANNKDNEMSYSKKFEQGFKIFRMRLKTWNEEIQIDDSEQVHPWQQYREESHTNTRHYKDKQEKIRFKPVHKTLFRKKTASFRK